MAVKTKVILGICRDKTAAETNQENFTAERKVVMEQKHSWVKQSTWRKNNRLNLHPQVYSSLFDISFFESYFFQLNKCYILAVIHIFINNKSFNIQFSASPNY